MCLINHTLATEENVNVSIHIEHVLQTLVECIINQETTLPQTKFKLLG